MGGIVNDESAAETRKLRRNHVTVSSRKLLPLRRCSLRRPCRLRPATLSTLPYVTEFLGRYARFDLVRHRVALVRISAMVRTSTYLPYLQPTCRFMYLLPA